MNNNHFLARKSGMITYPLISFILIAVIIVMVILFWWRGGSDAPASAVSTVKVRDLSFYVHERGVVRPARVVSIKSNISSNQAKLIWLYDEGQAVAEGELIARFDRKPFNDSVEKAELNLTDAKARLIGAEKALDLQQEENMARTEAAIRKLEIAKIQSDDLHNGTGRLNRRKQLLKINQARRAVGLQERELQDFDELLGAGHISQRERDKIADQLRKAKETVTVETEILENFDRYEMPRLLREADLLVDAATNEIERVKRTSTLEMARKRHETLKQRRDVKIRAEQFENAEQELGNCDIYAPIAGAVLYADIPRNGQKRRVQVGDSVWFGQAILEIPDTSDLIVEIHIREIDIAQLATGMRAIITLDAYPERKFIGELESINLLAQPDSDNLNVRRFNARIHFAQPDEDIRVGMSADVKVIYQTLHQVLSLDTAAIEYVNGKSIVQRVAADRTVRSVTIETGSVGPLWTEISAGLKAGDVVEVPGL